MLHAGNENWPKFLEEGGGSPTTAGLLGSGLLFIHSCSLNLLQISLGQSFKNLFNILTNVYIKQVFEILPQDIWAKF